MAARAPAGRDAGAASALALAVGLAIVIGAATGAVLGRVGAVDLIGESVSVAVGAVAPYYECPGGTVVADFQRGDRVFLTGVDVSGAWVQVRSPVDMAARVWLRTDQVAADDPSADLAVLDCLMPVEVVVEASTTSTSTTSTSTTSTSTTSTSTTSTSTTSTTAAPTTTEAPPSIGPPLVSPGTIWESYFGEQTCLANSGAPSVATVSVALSAPAGVQSVTMSWVVGGVSGSKAMTPAGGGYAASLGPFDSDDPNVVPKDGSLTITVTVRVTDSVGRSAQSQTTVTLNDCTFA